MQRDYEALQKYQLDPNRSFSLAQYDEVMDRVLRQFLTEHTNSVHEKEVMDNLAQWQEERNLVASGRVKYDGKWMSAAEAQSLIASDQAEQLLQRTRALISQSNFAKRFKRWISWARATGAHHNH